MDVNAKQSTKRVPVYKRDGNKVWIDRKGKQLVKYKRVGMATIALPLTTAP